MDLWISKPQRFFLSREVRQVLARLPLDTTQSQTATNDARRRLERRSTGGSRMNTYACQIAGYATTRISKTCGRARKKLSKTKNRQQSINQQRAGGDLLYSLFWLNDNRWVSQSLQYDTTHDFSRQAFFCSGWSLSLSRVLRSRQMRLLTRLRFDYTIHPSCDSYGAVVNNTIIDSTTTTTTTTTTTFLMVISVSRPQTPSP
jgi:hypothetical protein